MPIDSQQKACDIIDNQKEGMPYEAIRFLREQPTSNKLVKKVIFALKHAYDDTYYHEDEDYYYRAPLWYAIVAEEHLSKRLVDQVISLFTTTNDDWDFLDEQGMFLAGRLAEKYPDFVMKKIMKAIDRMIKKKSDYPYLFLYEAFYYIDPLKYKKWFLKTLREDNFYWLDTFVSHIADFDFKEAIPIIKNLLAKEERNNISRGELEHALRRLETGSDDSGYAESYAKSRGGWEEHYRGYENHFYDREDAEESNEEFEDELDDDYDQDDAGRIRVDKIGRNEPCLCGSGRKYKKCCGS